MSLTHHHPQSGRSARPGTLPLFPLERFLSLYEATAPHLLCSTGVTSPTWNELVTEVPELEAVLGAMSLGYPETRGTGGVRQAIAAYGMGTQQGLEGDLRAEQVVVTVGAAEAIYIALTALVGPGDEVIVQTPTYTSLYQVAESVGGRVKPWNMTCENGLWFLDFERLEALVTPNTRGLVVNVPNNPTGMTVSLAEWLQLIDWARERNLWMLADEVYRGLEHPGAETLPSVATLYERGISIGSASKGLGLPGLRLGWLASPWLTFLEEAMGVKDYTSLCTSPWAMAVLETLAPQWTSRVEENRQQCAQGWAVMAEFLAGHSNVFEIPARPQAGASVWVSLSGAFAQEGATPFCHRMAQSHGILMAPGGCFGDLWEGSVRMGFARHDLPAVLVQLEKALTE